MKYATIRTIDGTRAVCETDARFQGLGASDVGDLLCTNETGVLPTSGDEVGIGSEPEFAPLVIHPRKMLCVGHNYFAHINEMGREVPRFPTIFAKYASALVGARDDIRLPEDSSSMDWEAELAVVVGKRIRAVDEDEAIDAIAGFTVVNDISARDWQSRTSQWLQGKNFDGTTPIGPYLVTPDEVDHAADLEVRCSVNGKTVQRARTSDLIFGPATVLAYVSRIMTLEAGDVIALGTPGGVGAGHHPPVFLRSGDVVETTIEGVGTLVNRCVSARV